MQNQVKIEKIIYPQTSQFSFLRKTQKKGFLPKQRAELQSYGNFHLCDPKSRDPWCRSVCWEEDRGGEDGGEKIIIWDF